MLSSRCPLVELHHGFLNNVANRHSAKDLLHTCCVMAWLCHKTARSFISTVLLHFWGSQQQMLHV